MKKHHSIFGTKSIPNYRKQQFRNRGSRNDRRMVTDTSDENYEGRSDVDRTYEDQGYEDQNYEDQGYDDQNYEDQGYEDHDYEPVTGDSEGFEDGAFTESEEYNGTLPDGDSDLENEICNTTEETSGSYQNIDDTVLIKAAVKLENEKASNTDFPIDFLDDEISDDARDFDNEFDEDDQAYSDAINDEYEEDYDKDYDPYEEYEADEYEEYLEAQEEDPLSNWESGEQGYYGDGLDIPEEESFVGSQAEHGAVYGGDYEDLASDLREEAEKEGVRKASSARTREASGRQHSGRGNNSSHRSSSRRNGRSTRPIPTQRRNARRRKKKNNNVILFLKNSSTLEKISLVIGLIVVITSVALGSLIIRTKAKADELSSFSNIGCEINEMEVPGSSGLVAVADAQAARLAAAEAVSEAATAATSEEEEKGVKVNLSMASIKQDLKIKFLNSKTARLISGVPFEVSIKKPDGTTTTWKDDDKDGIIYHYDIPAGKYTVTIIELSGDQYSDYVFNTTSQTIEVKENIEYKPVDVSDEVKDESQVNVAVEDTAVEETVVESENTDTVEWVESTKTEIGSSGEYSYEEIKKDTIVNPYSAKGITDDGLQLITGTDSESGGNNSPSEASTSSPAASTTASTNSGSGNASTQNNNASGDNTSGQGGSNNDNSGGNGSNTGGTTEQPKTYTYELTPTSATIKVGDTATLTAKTSHDGISVAWTSSNTAVATVSNGTVTGVSAGTATITANFNNGEKSLTAQITVEKKEYTYSISKETLSLKTGATEKLTTETSLEDKTVTWASLDEKIAKVAADGTVTAVAAGTATVTATFKDGTKKTCTVTVTKGDGKIELSSTKATIIAGGSVLTLTAKVTGITDTTVIWKSSDESIATVDGGKVTGKKAGSVKITATSKSDASVTATCEVTVKDGAGELKDKNGNVVYVSENGSFRKATVADYDKATKFFIQKEGKLYSYTGWQTIDGYTYYYDKNGNYVTGDQVIQGAKYSFGADGRLSTGAGVLGIDVSKWNGSIDWSQVKNSGVSYVIIRCGYRGSSTGALIEDPKFRTNIQGATAAGLKVGVYFFTQAVSDVEAVEEASMVISLIKGYKISCPVFLDVEAAHGRADGISVSTRTAVCKAFCATIKGAGYTAGIYANKTWLNSYIDAPSLTGYKIWLAQYAAAPTYSRTRYDMWQYSSKGSISGISGRVDMNISYMGF